MSEVRDRGFPAMILAAGYGTRLAPVTDHVPKPLLPVGGRSLLDHAIATVTAAGAGPVAVNTHHLADAIHRHLKGRADADRFRLCHEPEIMGTGGALDGARVHLGGHPYFLLHNADVLCDADLGGLVDEHERVGAEATLLLVDWPEVNSVTLGDDGSIVAIGGDPTPGDRSRSLTYTGVAVIGEGILADIGSGFSSLIDPLVRALTDRPGSVRGYCPPGLVWHDLGTLGRWLAVQGAEADQPLGPGRLTALTGHGSDRRFWRLAIDDWSAVAMLAGPKDEEFARGAEIARFLHDEGLGGAEVLARDDREGALLSADLGRDRLFDRAGRGKERRRLYEAALDALLRLQGATGIAKDRCPEAVDRRLDEAVLRWETTYFAERMLDGHLGLDPGRQPGLGEEFDVLARAVADQPVVLLHRDFQSQNVMVGPAGIGLVDVQGLRLGPVGYDVMSLLYDPYVALPADERRALLDHWLDGVGDLPVLRGHGRVEVEAMALAAGLQRLMQALGAYGFLGRVKGKRSFLDHVPRGLAHLNEVLDRADAWAADHPEARPWLPAPFGALRAVLDRCGNGSRHRPLDGAGSAG